MIRQVRKNTTIDDDILSLESWTECMLPACTEDRSIKRNYFLGKVLGKGADATVRLGQHKSTGELVAIKLVHKEKMTPKLK